MKDGFCILNAVIIAVALNLIVPQLIKPYASPEEVNPPQGAVNLSPKQQLMHVMVRHAQVPILSSISIAAMIVVSVYLGYKLNPTKYF